jgi:hypothetical protein
MSDAITPGQVWLDPVHGGLLAGDRGVHRALRAGRDGDLTMEELD